jgi:hypothetical protein
MLKRTGGGRIGYLPARRWGVLRPGRRNTSEIQVRLGFGLGQGNGAGAGRGLRLARRAPTCPSAAAAVDEQTVDRVWDSVQGRAHEGQIAERLPLFLGSELHLEHHAPLVRMPRSVGSAIRQRCLDQGRVMLLLPSERRNLTVHDLYRPPLSHNRDITRLPAIRKALGPPSRMPLCRDFEQHGPTAQSAGRTDQGTWSEHCATGGNGGRSAGQLLGWYLPNVPAQ